MKVLWLVVAVLATIAVAVAIGLHVVPKPLPSFAGAEPPLAAVPLPDGPPAPIARRHRDLYGDVVPVVESAVVSGHATLRLMGITFQGRCRFVHDAGNAYRHYLDAALVGPPLLRVNEWFLGGNAPLEEPYGITELEPDGAKTPWLNQVRGRGSGWGEVDGRTVMSDASLTWFGDGAPWAEFRVDEVVNGVDVAAALRGRGP